MKSVSILEDPQYMKDASAQMLWEPECPYCHRESGYQIETDYNGELMCEFCEKKFIVEGM